MKLRIVIKECGENERYFLIVRNINRGIRVVIFGVVRNGFVEYNERILRIMGRD